MATSRTRRSTPTPSDPKLREVARHVVIPEGIVTTGWPAVEAKCRELFGVTFDQWQDDLGRVVFGKRADGLYAATIGGVWLSIPRQVAKTWFVMRIVFALCILFPGLKVLWTAHHTATLSNTFRSASGLARRAKVAPFVGNPDGGEGVRRGSGKEAILFKNGSAIYFGARDQGFGRGFDEVDVEVFDECQILNEKALEDMVAATNQSRHQHGALLFYMGTPGRPIDPCEVFSTRRADAISGQSEDTVYVECSADPDADPDDHEQWRKANPSFPKRTPLASMLRLRKNLVSVESWMREALGIWDVEKHLRFVYPIEEWAQCLDVDSMPGTSGHMAFSVDVSWDRSFAYVAVAAARDDGLIHAELIHRCDPSDVVAFLRDECAAFNPVGVALQSSGAPVSSLLEDLKRELGEDVLVQMSGSDMAKAFGATYDLVKTGGVRVKPDEENTIDRALRVAVSRALSDGGTLLDRKKSRGDIAPLVAMTNATYLLSISELGDPGIWVV